MSYILYLSFIFSINILQGKNFRKVCKEEKDNSVVIYIQVCEIVFVDFFNFVKAGIEIGGVFGQWRNGVKFMVIIVYGGVYVSIQKVGWEV